MNSEELRKTVSEFLTKHNLKIGGVSDIDGRSNEYNHRLFFFPPDFEPDGYSWKTDMVKMEDVAFWTASLDEIEEYGLCSLDCFINYDEFKDGDS